jgi:hypothetical protein
LLYPHKVEGSWRQFNKILVTRESTGVDRLGGISETTVEARCQPRRVNNVTELRSKHKPMRGFWQQLVCLRQSAHRSSCFLLVLCGAVVPISTSSESARNQIRVPGERDLRAGTVHRSFRSMTGSKLMFSEVKPLSPAFSRQSHLSSIKEGFSIRLRSAAKAICPSMRASGAPKQK